VPLYSTDARSRTPKHNLERIPKISIVTDITDLRSIPREIRAIVLDERRIIRDFSQWSQSKDGSDACLVWLAGDRLLEGSTSDLLKRLHSADRRSFVVVNTPCVEEIPFLTIQPRIFVKPSSNDCWSFRIRIESGAVAATQILADPDRPAEPWTKLVEAIFLEKATAGSGLESLVRLWESRQQLPDVIAALVLRNLVAAMLRYQKLANAREFLDAGAKLYPAYAEVHYLTALLAVREHRFGEAIPLLERAKACGLGFPGSGGENSYRCDWLLGVMAAKIGNDRVAFQHFLPGLKCNRVFEPSLTELLKLRLPRSIIESHQYVFTQAVRGDPKVAMRIADYLLTHGALDAARRIARTMPLDPAGQLLPVPRLDAPPMTTAGEIRKARPGLCSKAHFLNIPVLLGSIERSHTRYCHPAKTMCAWNHPLPRRSRRIYSQAERYSLRPFTGAFIRPT
jgi:hypothetical protein